MGLAPQEAIAATDSCICASVSKKLQTSQYRVSNDVEGQTDRPRASSKAFGESKGRKGQAPAMLPCSQSTHTQSKPALAMNRDRFAPGNICHAPNEAPEPDARAFCSRLADFITEAIYLPDRDAAGLVDVKPLGWGDEIDSDASRVIRSDL